MSQVFQHTAASTSLGASSTRNHAAAQGSGAAVLTESTIQIPYHTAGTLSGLYVRVITNDRGASTLKLRKGGSNANQTISIGSSTTGEFQDTTNTDTVANNDLFNLQSITGSGGTTFTLKEMGIAFSSNSDTTVRQVALGGGVITGTSQTFYSPLSGGLAQGSASNNEAFIQNTFRTAGTLKNMSVHLSSNARSQALTFRSRIGGSNGNLSVSVSAGLTGLFEDTSNSDSISAGNLVNTAMTQGSDSGLITVDFNATDFSTTNSTWEVLAGNPNVSTVSANTTVYISPGGNITNSATESDVQALATVSYTASRLKIYVSANTVSAASTLTFRKNAGNGNQTVSIISSTTGLFEDTSNSDTVLSTDEINTKLVTGATGTSLGYNLVSFLATGSGVAPMRMMMGMGF